MDATAFGVAPKVELEAAFRDSRLLADLATGRLVDFDETQFQANSVQLLNANDSKPVFCAGEAPLLDEVTVADSRLLLRYEADVTACAQQPPTSAWLAGDSIQVDKQVVAFAMTFTCSSRAMELFKAQASVRTVMADPAAFACSGSGKQTVSTGRAWRFIARTEGRFSGPRSEVPVEQKFWRGYDSGSPGQICSVTKDASGTNLGACRFYERSESRNLIDDSRRGRLLLADVTARKRSEKLFADGSMTVRFNGWAGISQFSPQVTEIKVNMTRPSGECAGFVMRPVMANFESVDCR